MSCSAKVKHLFNQIESIKSTMSMKNSNKPELWVQRQNLQDLYHQIILNDIDFTIDKKLEQDLWNLVFKSQINYFQQQIKENSLSTSSSSSAASSATSKANKTISSQKKYEAQASLFFFLEAARGFYTKLLEDIVLTYDSKEMLTKRTGSFLLPFCQRFQSIFDKINNAFDTNDQSTNSTNAASTKTANEKQILYICQHILTHLGDIARYANLFQQAKNYYLHAIILVPYLGHPYNQLGILFETSRTNQLGTVFYYFRSVAVRYKFPLATTNLENFLLKLVDIPITRYNPSNIELSDLLSTAHSDTYVIKLAHKDLLTLFLEITGFIYFLTNPTPKKSPSDLTSKLEKFLDLFKYAFESFIRQPGQKEKLDSFQLCQLMSISVFLLASSSSASFAYSLKLFSNLLQNLLILFSDSPSDELGMPSLYLAFAYLSYCDELNLVLTNKLFQQNTNREQTSKFIYLLLDMLNKLSELKLDDDLEKTSEYPLNEDRLLDSFLPLKNYHSNLNIAKYLRSSEWLSESSEASLRKKRLLKSVEILLERDSARACYVMCSPNESANKFKLNERVLPGDLVRKEAQSHVSEPKKEDVKLAQEEQTSQPTRRRRQNVAIHSITQKNLNIQQQKLESNNTNKPLIVQNEPIKVNNSLKMITNPSLVSKPSISNNVNSNQQQSQSIINQIAPSMQANFFPSALNRKFPSQQNGGGFLNENSLLSNNTHHLQPTLQPLSQISRPRQDGTNFFLSTSQTQLNQSSLNQFEFNNNMSKNNTNFTLNQAMRPPSEFESNLNQLSNMSVSLGLNRQQSSGSNQLFKNPLQSSSFFNDLNSPSLVDHNHHPQMHSLSNSANTSSTTSSSSIWPTTLPFTTNLDKTDSLFQNKPNWFDQNKSTSSIGFNEQLMNMLNIQNQQQKVTVLNEPSASNSDLLSNLLFQLNSDASRTNDNKQQQQQQQQKQNSIWSFNSSN